jgi:hypothetical protein
MSMFASTPPVTPARLVGKEAHDALTATYGGKTPSAGNWIGATNDDDGIATTLCFSKAAYATPTSGAGSAGLQAARELRSTLTSAHGNVTWLPTAVHMTARAAIERCLEIASRPLDRAALNLLDVVATDILARETYEDAQPGSPTRTPALGNVSARAYFESEVLENLAKLETYAAKMDHHVRSPRCTVWPPELYVAISPTATKTATDAAPEAATEAADPAPAPLASAAPVFPGTGWDGKAKSINVHGFGPCNIVSADGPMRHRVTEADKATRDAVSVDFMSAAYERRAQPVLDDIKRPIHVLHSFVKGCVPADSSDSCAASGAPLVVLNGAIESHKSMVDELARAVPDVRVADDVLMTGRYRINEAAFKSIRTAASTGSLRAKALLEIAQTAQAGAHAADMTMRSCAVLCSLLCKAIDSGAFRYADGPTKDQDDLDLQSAVACTLRWSQQNAMLPAAAQYRAVVDAAGLPEMLLATDPPGQRKRGRDVLTDADASELKRLRKETAAQANTIKQLQSSNPASESSGRGGHAGHGRGAAQRLAGKKKQQGKKHNGRKPTAPKRKGRQ